MKYQKKRMLSNDSNLTIPLGDVGEYSHKKGIPKNKFNDKTGKEKESKSQTNVCTENISFLLILKCRHQFFNLR